MYEEMFNKIFTPEVRERLKKYLDNPNSSGLKNPQTEKLEQQLEQQFTGSKDCSNCVSGEE